MLLAAILLSGAGPQASGSPESKKAVAKAASNPMDNAVVELRRRSADRATGTDLPVRSRAKAALGDAAAPAPPKPTKVLPAPGAITGLFGEIRGGGRAHGGIDIDGETGDPVVSAAAGLVVHSGPAPIGLGGFGNLVVVNHPDGSHALYAHLSSMNVPVGTVVSPGTPLGTIGTTGFVTGSHLHWEVRIGAVPIDPFAWLASR